MNNKKTSPYSSPRLVLTDPKTKPALPYPFARVWFGLTFLGGAVGGALLFVYLLLIEGIADGTEPMQMLIYAGFLMAAGAVVGLIPAAITATWLAAWQTQRTAAGLLHAAVAGTLSTALCIAISLQDLSAMTLSPLGTVAALILATWLLPSAKPLS